MALSQSQLLLLSQWAPLTLYRAVGASLLKQLQTKSEECMNVTLSSLSGVVREAGALYLFSFVYNS